MNDPQATDDGQAAEAEKKAERQFARVILNFVRENAKAGPRFELRPRGSLGSDSLAFEGSFIVTRSKTNEESISDEQAIAAIVDFVKTAFDIGGWDEDVEGGADIFEQGFNLTVPKILDSFNQGETSLQIQIAGFLVVREITNTKIGPEPTPDPINEEPEPDDPAE